MVDKCINPSWIPTDKEYINVDTGNTIHHVKVGCGKCVFCQRSIKLDWIFRMEQEGITRLGESIEFLTLTFADHAILPPKTGVPRKRKSESHRAYSTRVRKYQEHLQRSEEMFCKKDIERFVQSVRDELRATRQRVNLKYFCVSEYGSQTWRPHLHMIVWGMGDIPAHEHWPHGHVDQKPCKLHHIQYVVDYLNKEQWPEIMKDNPHFTGKQEFRTMSQGIGKEYLDRMSAYDKRTFLERGELTVVNNHGIKHGLPRYYKLELRKQNTQDEEFALTSKILTRTSQKQDDAEMLRQGFGITEREWLMHNIKKDGEKRHKYRKKRREPDGEVYGKAQKESVSQTMGAWLEEWTTRSANQSLLRQHQDVRSRYSDQRPSEHESNSEAARVQPIERSLSDRERKARGEVRPAAGEIIF